MSRTSSYFSYGNKTPEIGRITSLSDTISTSTLNSNIPMLKAEEQFDMDTGSTNTIRITAEHVNGDADSWGYSQNNADWMQGLIDLINRWQAETNGCKFHYTPSDDVKDYIPEYRGVNCFADQIQLTWNSKVPEVIKADINLKVGSMMGGYSSSEQTTPVKDMTIRMSDLNGTMHDLIYTNDGLSVIESMTLEGGLDQPFESLSMKIPRTRLGEVSSSFVSENGFRVGTNVIYLNNAMGWGYFIVASVKSDKTNYTINAYSVAELFKSLNINKSYGARAIVTVTKGYTVEFGISMPPEAVEDLCRVQISYIDETGSSTFVNVTSEEYRVRCLLDSSGRTTVTLRAYNGRTMTFNRWGRGGSDDNPFEIEITSGKSYGTGWKLTTEGDTQYYWSDPPVVTTELIPVESENTSYQYFTPYRPIDIIKDILSNQGVEVPQLGVFTFSESNPIHNGHLYLDVDEDSWAQLYIYFPQGTNAWYVLQICAYFLGAKIHFSDGDCYITGISRISSSGNIELGSSGSDYKSMMNVPVLGSEKTENIINTVKYNYGTQDTYVPAVGSSQTTVRYVQGSVRNSASINYYGEKSVTKTLFGIRMFTTASKISQNIMKFNYAGNQSVTVSMVENKNGQWTARFGNEFYPARIHDEVNDAVVTPKAPYNSTLDYVLLGLRKYERQFPQCVTKYTFGPQNPTNLALKVSQLDNSTTNQ